ncbi:MAG: cysteine desulfurase [candidate division KSB1 bacterium]|nr:cysteine desulfurase [candidate division KSB1 bacterium]
MTTDLTLRIPRRTVGRAAPLDVQRIRRDFPLLRRRRDLVYLDNAATTQRPQCVLAAMARFSRETNANVHRGAYRLSEEATQAYEDARATVAAFLNAPSPACIVFTRNATESINLVAYAWALNRVRAGEQIILTEMEHHSNLVPWQMVARKTGARLEFVRIGEKGDLSLEHLERLLKRPTALLAVTHASNVLGTVNPIARITRLAHAAGVPVLVDAAQSVPHLVVDVQELDADFVAFSAHKMLGPMGIGVLYARRERLEEAEPFLFGGDMILSVGWHQATWNEIPWRFEAGTPNVAGAVGLAEAIRYLRRVGMDRIWAHDQDLLRYAFVRLGEIPGLRIYGPGPEKRVGVISFNVDGVHPHDLASFLDARGIAVRAGHHCAQPLMERLGVIATVRVSFYIYNRTQEIDQLVDALHEARRFFLQ